MRIEKCSFCGCNVYPGHGQVFVRNDCKSFRFCRSKCKKNFALKRNPMKVRWTKTFRRAANKELTMDRTLQFEEKRNVPVRYDRELVTASVDAMKRIAQIRQKRSAQHWAKRMEVRDLVETREGLRELQRNLDMVEDPVLREHARKVMQEGQQYFRSKTGRHHAAHVDNEVEQSESVSKGTATAYEAEQNARDFLIAQNQSFMADGIQNQDETSHMPSSTRLKSGAKKVKKTVTIQA